MRRLATLIVVALLGLSGCGCRRCDHGLRRDRLTSSASANATTIRRYVALGDSYTAAPYVYLTDVANGCLRSSGNYPALLAERLDVAKHVDVSCSGATSKDLAGRQDTFQQQTVPPQLGRGHARHRPGHRRHRRQRLRPVRLAGRHLPDQRSAGPHRSRRARASGAGRSTCARRPPTSAGSATLITRDLRAIHQQGARRDRRAGRLSPHPRPDTTCPKVLPVARRDTIALNAVTRSLSQQMRSAAHRTGSRLRRPVRRLRGTRRLCRQERLGQRRPHRHRTGRRPSTRSPRSSVPSQA